MAGFQDSTLRTPLFIPLSQGDISVEAFLASLQKNVIASKNVYVITKFKLRGCSGENILRYFIQNNLGHYPVMLFVKNHMDSGKKKTFQVLCTSKPFVHPLHAHPPVIHFTGSLVVGDVGRERRRPLNPVNYSVVHSSGLHVVRLQHAVNGDTSKVALLDNNAAL